MVLTSDDVSKMTVPKLKAALEEVRRQTTISSHPTRSPNQASILFAARTGHLGPQGRSCRSPQ